MPNKRNEKRLPKQKAPLIASACQTIVNIRVNLTVKGKNNYLLIALSRHL